MTLSVKEVFGNRIEERIEELMREGKESPIRGWSARDISKTIAEEFRWLVDEEGDSVHIDDFVDKADVIEMFAFNHIRELCGVK